jgi:CNT family concentrative nucleoside transporter
MMDAVLRVGFGLFGLAVLIGIAWLFSNNKRLVDWKLVETGVFVQILFAAFVLLTPYGEAIFSTLAHGFVQLSAFTNEGAKMILGSLTDQKLVGQPIADAMGVPGPDAYKQFGFIFAFQVLPTVVFFAALTAILYHLGIMQWVVKGMAWAITKVMKLSGAETTSVCASVFIGQTEAPLTVRPYISKMTDSELLTMMIGGMAHIAGGVMATYIAMLGGGDKEAMEIYAKHFLAASIMAAPATFILAKILIPETQEPLTRGTIKMEIEKTSANVIDAAAAGAGDGMKLAINIAAMLLAFVALIALLNAIIGGISEAVGLTAWLNSGKDALCMTDPAFAANPANGCIQVNLGTILGAVLAPIAWVIGIPWQDAAVAGSLIGQKIVLNEFIAYLQLSALPVGAGPGAITEETKLILTYALCGFANFASIAIQIGGIGSLAPERRSDLARFGLRAVLGGSIATLMTATIAGVLIHLR